MADGFIFRSSYYEAAKALPKKEQANVILGICAYAFCGEEPELGGMSKIIFDLMRTAIDVESESEEEDAKRKQKNREYSQRYRERKKTTPSDDCQMMRQMIVSSPSDDASDDASDFRQISPPSSPLKPPNNPQKERVSKDTPKKKTPKEFVPPTLEEVEAYCKQRNSSVNPKDFFDFFDAGDWYDSKGNPVIAWKQKLITWEKHNPKPKEEAPIVEEVTRPRWIETAPFEGYWEYFENGEWVRHDDW